MYAIEVEKLSKCYRIEKSGREHVRSNGARLWESLWAPFHRLRHGASHGLHTEDFWALREVSFHVEPGEVLGIIGRNGAGKSTLLKILSRITGPTSGRAVINGRVGSLLEVGTGFHPDLTGKENIYLNGSLLGMSRREVQQKFDQIVEFAGIGPFIDTPVKRYSSGMRVRLGFAVAAHLQPEILIIDEVLAVGDVEFQRRCLGKMDEVSRSGRTVLFVSHNMNSIHQLTQRCLLLEGGRLAADGQASEVVDHYLALQSTRARGEITPDMHRLSTKVQFHRVELRDTDDQIIQAPKSFTPFRIHVYFEALSEMPQLYIVIALMTLEGSQVVRIHNPRPLLGTPVKPGHYHTSVELELPLCAGNYGLVLRADDSSQPRPPVAHVTNALNFDLLDAEQEPLTDGPYRWIVPLLPLESKWTLEETGARELTTSGGRVK